MKPPLSKGFTLTELLVVIAILMSLMGLVLSSTSGSSRRPEVSIRRGAQQLASILLASQSLSLGSPTGAAVIIDSQGSFGETYSQARRFPFIEGFVTQWTVTSATSRTVKLTPTNDESSALVHGYKIRFLERVAGTDGPVSDWFALSCPNPPDATVRLRNEDGQTSQTSLWPTPTSGTLSFQAARYPIPAGLSLSLPAGVAIDLRLSGYEGLANWNDLSGRGAIAVGFDPVGSVDSLMQNVLPADGKTRTVQPVSPHDRIYFFVTLRAEIGDPTVNTLASDKALWVVIHPRTGRVTIAPNVPQRTADAAALRAARTKARQGMNVGG